MQKLTYTFTWQWHRDDVESRLLLWLIFALKIFPQSLLILLNVAISPTLPVPGLKVTQTGWWILIMQSNYLKKNCRRLCSHPHKTRTPQRSAVDKTWNMEHPGTFRNIPEHPGTSNNYDNCEKKYANLNFGLARVTIWSAQNGHVGHVTCSFSPQAEQLYFEMNRTEELSTVGNQLKKYIRSLIIDDILSEGGNVST